MFYYLFDFLDKQYDIIGAGVFRFISFRAGMALVSSLLIAMLFGNKFIAFLHAKQIGETVRDLGLAGQKEKQGTPTMGGIIILICLLLPVFLFGRITNVYVVLLIVSAVWMGAIGFLDDYIKVFKKNKEGLKGKFKIVGQVGLGLIVGLTLYFNENVVVRQYVQHSEENVNLVSDLDQFQVGDHYVFNDESADYKDIKSNITTIPFLKGNEFNYSSLVSFMSRDLTWVVYVLVVIFIVTAVSNGANITDGIDGLTAGVSAIVGSVLAVLAYVSGNSIFADYLNIMYLPNTGEIVIFASAFVGACVGFLWFNSFPARIFMGDTGSLAIGGIIAVMALAIRKEFLIPILCGIFLIELVSVMVQVSYFKYTKKKYGEGRRVFLMSPLHHHYQKKGLHESKIVTRFWIVGLLLAVVTLATLKLR